MGLIQLQAKCDRAGISRRDLARLTAMAGGSMETLDLLVNTKIASKKADDEEDTEAAPPPPKKAKKAKTVSKKGKTTMKKTNLAALERDIRELAGARPTRNEETPAGVEPLLAACGVSSVAALRRERARAHRQVFSTQPHGGDAIAAMDPADAIAVQTGNGGLDADGMRTVSQTAQAMARDRDRAAGRGAAEDRIRKTVQLSDHQIAALKQAGRLP